jgi:hypothetical protein
MPAGAEPR